MGIEVLIAAKHSSPPKESETGFFGFHIHQGENGFETNSPGIGNPYHPAEQAHPKYAVGLLLFRGNAYLAV